MTRLLYFALVIFLCGPATAQETINRDALAAADYAAGRLAFLQRCSACHTLADGALDLQGPNLFGMFERPAGSLFRVRVPKQALRSQSSWGRRARTLYDLADGKVRGADTDLFRRRSNAEDARPTQIRFSQHLPIMRKKLRCRFLRPRSFARHPLRERLSPPPVHHVRGRSLAMPCEQK